MEEGEQVLVIPRDELFAGLGTPHGFGEEHLGAFLDRIGASARFEDRAAVEEDPSRKQIIPYMVVTDGTEVLLLRRGSRQAEARLHHLYSIGVGGHINPVDGGGADPVAEGLRRELAEELHVDGEPEVEPLGYLNDESNPVGSVHFGLVYRVTAEPARVRVAEEDRMEGSFVPLEELGRRRSEMETWSQLLVDSLLERPGLLAGGEALP